MRISFSFQGLFNPAAEAAAIVLRIGNVIASMPGGPGVAPGAGGMPGGMSTNYLDLAVMINIIMWIEMAINASKARTLFPRAGSGKETRHKPAEDNSALLEGADVAWQQYKKGQGKRVTSSEELKDFLDSL